MAQLLNSRFCYYFGQRNQRKKESKLKKILSQLEDVFVSFKFTLTIVYCRYTHLHCYWHLHPIYQTNLKQKVLIRILSVLIRILSVLIRILSVLIRILSVLIRILSVLIIILSVLIRISSVLIRILSVLLTIRTFAHTYSTYETTVIIHT